MTSLAFERLFEDQLLLEVVDNCALHFKDIYLVKYNSQE